MAKVFKSLLAKVISDLKDDTSRQMKLSGTWKRILATRGNGHQNGEINIVNEKVSNMEEKFSKGVGGGDLKNKCCSV